MLLAMVVLTGLATISALTVVSVEGGFKTTANDRFHSIAVYAAESGGAAAMEYLRANVSPTQGWKAFISASNATLVPLPAIYGNNVLPGVTGNPFSTDVRAWYHIDILNDRADPGYATGFDSNLRVIIRATGHGPNGALAILEWDVASGTDSTQRPCTGYAQENLSEDNSGTNECLKNIQADVTATYTP